MEIYRRLIPYIKPYKYLLLFGILLTILAGASEVLISGVIYVTTNGLMNREVVSLEGIPHLPPQCAVTFGVIWVPFIIVGVFLLKGLLSYFSKYLMAVIGFKSVRNLQNDLFKHVSRLSCDYFTEQRVGDLMSRMTGDVRGMQSAITSVVLDAFKAPITILFTVPVIFIMGGWLALICVAVFPLVSIPIVILGRKIRKLTNRLLESNADILSYLGEILPGIKIVKTFNAEDRENKKFDELSLSICNFYSKTFRATELQRPVIELMGAIGVSITIYFALKTLPFDRFMTFAGSLYLLYEPAKKLSKINVVVQQTIANGKRIFAIMDTKPSIIEKKDASEFKEPFEKISFENVSFHYEEGPNILDDINLQVKKGESLAIVGPSGSGKTTLVSLIPRFYDPTVGYIQINDTRIGDMTCTSLREMISVVSQETVLFGGSIKDNIVYGKPDASFEEMTAAATAANAHEFIMGFKDGYDTLIGERGAKLSGGQRQRVSIARAILKNPPVLIFDEATSHLDTKSEREVQKAIENLMKGRTVFVIAHRLSTVQNADKIVVIDGGKIVQVGTHADLIKEQGMYKHLYDMQFSI